MNAKKLDPTLLMLLDAPQPTAKVAEVFLDLGRPATPTQAAHLESMGVRVRAGQTLLRGTVPLALLAALSEQPNVKYIRATQTLRPLAPA